VQSAGTLPAVQKAALHVFSLIVPRSLPELWPHLFDALLRLLRPELLGLAEVRPFDPVQV
jgi:hypothetical protein